MRDTYHKTQHQANHDAAAGKEDMLDADPGAHQLHQAT